MSNRPAGIRACIVTVSLPTTLAACEAMLEKNMPYTARLPELERDRRLTDLDTLLEWTPAWKDAFGWSALKGMDAGDVVLFYHGAASASRARSLRRQYDERQRHAPPLVAALTLAAHQAARYAGTIFGCARVSGPTTWQRVEDEDGAPSSPHHVASLDVVHVFEQPLRADHFNDLLEINRFSALTTFRPAVFEQLKQRLMEDNPAGLPAFLETAMMQP